MGTVALVYSVACNECTFFVQCGKPRRICPGFKRVELGEVIRQVDNRSDATAS